MFARAYFPAAFFAPAYFPPAVVIVARPAASGGGVIRAVRLVDLREDDEVLLLVTGWEV